MNLERYPSTRVVKRKKWLYGALIYEPAGEGWA